MTQQWDETPERDMTEKDYGDDSQPKQQKDPAGTQYDSGSGRGWTKILPSQPQQHCGHDCFYKREILNQSCAIPRCQYDTRSDHHSKQPLPIESTKGMERRKSRLAPDGSTSAPEREESRHTCTNLNLGGRHLITDTRTGKQYTTDLQQLCIDAGLSDRLTYCDIECLLTDGETWYMLDECGNWAYLPSVYKVEVVR